MKTVNNIEEAAAELHAMMRKDILDRGEDPDDIFVTYINVGDDICKVVERGSLIECIVMGLSMLEGDEDKDDIPQITTAQDFADKVVPNGMESGHIH